MSGEGNISGSALLGQLRATEQVLGPEGAIALRARLSPEDAAILDGITAVGWVPIAVAWRLNEHGAAIAGREPRAFLDQVTAASLDHAYKTIWRALMRFTSDDALVTRASAMIHRAFDRGTVSARVAGPGRAEVTVSAWPAMHDRAFYGLRVAIERVLMLSGREDVRVVATRTSDGARYDATFRR